MNKYVFTADPDLALSFTTARSAEVDSPPLVGRDPRLDVAVQTSRLGSTVGGRRPEHGLEGPRR